MGEIIQIIHDTDTVYDIIFGDKTIHTPHEITVVKGREEFRKLFGDYKTLDEDFDDSFIPVNKDYYLDEKGKLLYALSQAKSQEEINQILIAGVLFLADAVEELSERQ